MEQPNYAALIADAMQKNGFKTRYQLAKALNYKNISVIYQVEKGKRGLRPARLMRLLQLAGKMMLAAMVTAAVLHVPQGEARDLTITKLQRSADLFIHYAQGLSEMVLRLVGLFRTDRTEPICA